MYREYRDLTVSGAVTQCYRDMGSRHRARAHSVQVCTSAFLRLSLLYLCTYFHSRFYSEWIYSNARMKSTLCTFFLLWELDLRLQETVYSLRLCVWKGWQAASAADQPSSSTTTLRSSSPSFPTPRGRTWRWTALHPRSPWFQLIKYNKWSGELGCFTKTKIGRGCALLTWKKPDCRMWKNI